MSLGDPYPPEKRGRGRKKGGREREELDDVRQPELGLSAPPPPLLLLQGLFRSGGYLSASSSSLFENNFERGKKNRRAFPTPI